MSLEYVAQPGVFEMNLDKLIQSEGPLSDNSRMSIQDYANGRGWYYCDGYYYYSTKVPRSNVTGTSLRGTGRKIGIIAIKVTI